MGLTSWWQGRRNGRSKPSGRARACQIVRCRSAADLRGGVHRRHPIISYVKVRDGQVGNRPFYAAIGVDLAGRRDVLGLWAGTGVGESAKFWIAVLT